MQLVTRVGRHWESLRKLDSGRGGNQTGDGRSYKAPLGQVMCRPESWESWDGVDDTGKEIKGSSTDTILSNKQCPPVLDLLIKISAMPCCKWLRIPTSLPILDLETIIFPFLYYKAEHYKRCLEPNGCHSGGYWMPLVFTVSCAPGCPEEVEEGEEGKGSLRVSSSCVVFST